MSLLDRILEPYRCLGWRFPAIMLSANLAALALALVVERWR